MYSKVYPFSLESLLSILVEAELPRSWQSIVIKETGSRKWMKSVYLVEMQQLFAAKGFDMKLENDDRGRWVVTVTS